MSNRSDQEREALLQPKRMEVAKSEIQKLGFVITYENETRIDFTFNGSNINYYPYSGWATGKSIKDGRGLQKLLRQLK